MKDNQQTPPTDRRGPPFTTAELSAAHDICTVGRISVTSAWMETSIPYLQRRGVVSVQVVDYPRGKPLWVDVSLTDAAQEAINAE